MKLLTSNAKDVSKNAQFSIISFDFGCRYTHIFKQAQQILEKQTKAKLIIHFLNSIFLLHKNKVLQLMSAVTSLERLGEKYLVFIK